MSKIHMKGGPWSNTEDEILKSALSKYGLQNWERVASMLPRKTSEQCRDRWNQYLNPHLKIREEWDEAEERKLVELQSLFPEKWQLISQQLSGGRRPAWLCKEHFEELTDRALYEQLQQQQGSATAITSGGEAGNDASVTSLITQETQLEFLQKRKRQREGEDFREANNMGGNFGAMSSGGSGVPVDYESRPARRDATDLLIFEREMVEMARSRLGNQDGKKGLRLERTKQMAHTTFLAKLENYREGVESGTLSGNAKRKMLKVLAASEQQAPPADQAYLRRELEAMGLDHSEVEGEGNVVDDEVEDFTPIDLSEDKMNAGVQAKRRRLVVDRTAATHQAMGSEDGVMVLDDHFYQRKGTADLLSEETLVRVNLLDSLGLERQSEATASLTEGTGKQKAIQTQQQIAVSRNAALTVPRAKGREEAKPDTRALLSSLFDQGAEQGLWLETSSAEPRCSSEASGYHDAEETHPRAIHTRPAALLLDTLFQPSTESVSQSAGSSKAPFPVAQGSISVPPISIIKEVSRASLERAERLLRVEVERLVNGRAEGEALGVGRLSMKSPGERGLESRWLEAARATIAARGAETAQLTDAKLSTGGSAALGSAYSATGNSSAALLEPSLEQQITAMEQRAMQQATSALRHNPLRAIGPFLSAYALYDHVQQCSAFQGSGDHHHPQQVFIRPQEDVSPADCWTQWQQRVGPSEMASPCVPSPSINDEGEEVAIAVADGTGKAFIRVMTSSDPIRELQRQTLASQRRLYFFEQIVVPAERREVERRLNTAEQKLRELSVEEAALQLEYRRFQRR